MRQPSNIDEGRTRKHALIGINISTSLTRDEMTERMVLALGEPSTGAEADLERATRLARDIASFFAGL